MVDIPHFELAILLVFIAAVVRGYTGFGFAAIAIAGMNLIWPPQISVPVVLMLDFVGTIGMIPRAWHDADKPITRRLFTGALFGIPLGLTILVQVPDTLLKLVISGSILLMTLLLRKPLRSQQEIPRLSLLMGGIAGAFTAAASIGGLPIVCYLLTTSLNTRAQRATLVLFLSAIGLLSLLLMMIAGLVGTELLLPALMLLLPTLAGMRLGHWAFERKTPQSFRPVALPILVLLSVSSLGFSTYHLV